MHSPSSTEPGSGLSLLPFGGLGLDVAEVRRKVSGLLLVPFLKQEAPRQEPRFDAPPALSGAELLVRLGRQTLGS
jgi:hypothetical protein